MIQRQDRILLTTASPSSLILPKSAKTDWAEPRASRAFTLAPEARMDRIVGEVRHAIHWLHEHLADYGADPGRIYVAGHAGGHLTAVTMPLGIVRGGMAISGLYDLGPIRLSMRSRGSTRPRRNATARCSIFRRRQVR